MTVTKSLPPATTSYAVSLAVKTPPSNLRYRQLITAKAEPSDKSVEIMRKFSEQYARKSGTYFCVDKSVTSVVIKLVDAYRSCQRLRGDRNLTGSESLRYQLLDKDGGLADHKDSLGAPLCPCRHYDDKSAEATQGFWNCPCVPMRERKECHCMLFLTPENDFAGDEQVISLEEIKETTANM